jgi:hypothetical protein
LLEMPKTTMVHSMMTRTQKTEISFQMAMSKERPEQ